MTVLDRLITTLADVLAPPSRETRPPEQDQHSEPVDWQDAYWTTWWRSRTT